MAQAQVNNEQEIQIIAMDEEKRKRKVNLCIGEQHYISVFQNEQKDTVVNIRKGTRSVSITKQCMTEICDLKETILLCCSFVEAESKS